MAGENYHHGPEIVESFVGSQSVVDVKAATCFLEGTAPIQNLYDTPEKRAAFINQPIIIRTPADAVAAFGPASVAAGYSIPEALQAFFNKDQAGKGVGTIVVNNVFDPDRHINAQGKPDPTQVTAADLVGDYDAAGRPTGMNVAYSCFNKFGFFPRRIIAPRFTGLLGLRQKMLTVANDVKGHAIYDLPPGMKKQDALTARGVGGDFNVASERAVLCYPQVLALDPVTGGQSLQPYSQHFAGVWNTAVSQIGPNRSPSNLSMPDVSGTETDIFFMPGSYASDTDMLNEVGIATTMTYYGAGINTWGASSAAWPTVKNQTAWLHGRAVCDVIEDAILFYAMPYIDQMASPSIVDMVEERVRAYLHTKEPGGDSWLYGSNFTFDRTRNTAEQIANEGRVYYSYSFAIMGIMHRITIEASIDLTFVSTALGLVAAA
ncbi:MAG: phage tail sheath family protein [Hyphomicrobiales bacterium]|nr:phage tail sheath family protein [Hyphomicrobiales bacterium]